jgi:two-component system chemotaxis family response regulator WspR
LVDDQRIIGEAVRRLLADQPDIQFHYCALPEEAVSRANEIHPGIILQDMVMPGIDGPAMVRLFRANAATARTPIIVLTGSEDAESRSLASAAGANDYLVKLPTKADLLARLRAHATS